MKGKLMTTERYVVTRTIPVAPAQVFAVLADPVRHHDTEPGDWVRDSKDPDGPSLRFSRRAWDAFLAGARAGEFDQQRFVHRAGEFSGE